MRRDELLLKLGAAKKEAGRTYHLVDIRLPQAGEAVTADTFAFDLRRDRLRRARRREGRYLLRSNLTGEDPATLWRYYMQLTEIEQASKELKHDLAIRPIFHQREERIEAHIFVAFIAYCLHVTVKHMARPCAPGLTPRAILEKFSTLQMVDVHLPTADGRHLTLPRHTQPTRRPPTATASTQAAIARTAVAAHLGVVSRQDTSQTAPCSADLWRLSTNNQSFTAVLAPSCGSRAKRAVTIVCGLHRPAGLRALVHGSAARLLLCGSFSHPARRR